MKPLCSAILRASSVAAVLGVSATVAFAQTGANQVESGHREILLETTKSWNGAPYTHYPAGLPDIATIKVTLAPHTALPWHSHPFPNSVYVLSGTLA
jgi:quercetin dioxygenase-like cupin family protein